MKRQSTQFNSISAAAKLGSLLGTLGVELCGVSFTVVPFAGGTEWRSATPRTSKGQAQRPYLCGTSMMNHGIDRTEDRFNLGH